MCQSKNNFDPHNILRSRLDSVTLPILDNFSCGNTFIDNFFRNKAAASTDHTTHIFWDIEEDCAVAAVSFACAALNPLYGSHTVCDSIPAVEITYFAVDKKYQKVYATDDPDDGYISDWIMAQTIGLIYYFTESFCAASTAILYSTPYAVRFYERNGFVIADTSKYWRKQSHKLDQCVLMYQQL